MKEDDPEGPGDGEREATRKSGMAYAAGLAIFFSVASFMGVGWLYSGRPFIGIMLLGAWISMLTIAYVILAIAVGICLADAGRSSSRRAAFLGELSLDGAVRHVNGVLVLSRFLAARGIREIFVPPADAAEAALAGSLTVFGYMVLPAVAALTLTRRLSIAFVIAIVLAVVATLCGVYISSWQGSERYRRQRRRET